MIFVGILGLGKLVIVYYIVVKLIEEGYEILFIKDIEKVEIYFNLKKI